MRKESISDYVRWRGDLDFSRVPFSRIDNLVLCQLAYINLEEIVLPDSAGIPLADCADLYQQLHPDEKIDEKLSLFYACALSKRYGGLIVRNYEDILNDAKDIQFAAMEFVLDENTSFLAFRGTTPSVIGWKEDFMISFTLTNGQERAAQYVWRVMDPARRYYIGGHSKGGNLAVYAAVSLDEKRRNCILRVFDNDGPGFCEDVLDPGILEPVLPLVSKTVPQYDIIGKLFPYPTEDLWIVASNARGAMGHEMYTWSLDGPNLVIAGEYDRSSERVTNILIKWINSLNQEERKIFVEEFFGAFQKNGVENLEEITASDMIAVLKSMANTSPTAKKAAWELLAMSFKRES